MTRIHIDCETTGLNPDIDVLLEFSWYNEETGTCHTMYNPEFKYQAFRRMVAKILRGSDAGEVNRYLERFGDDLDSVPHTRSGFFTASLSTLAALQMGGDTLVGFNVAFDINFLNNYGAQLTTHRTLDLTSFFTGVLYAPRDYRQIAPLGFRDVIARVKPEFREHIPSPDHTSAGDVAATVALMRMYSMHGLSLFIPVWDIPQTEMP